MAEMSAKRDALARLDRQLTALAELPKDRHGGGELFERWRRATRVALERTFGEGSKQSREFATIAFYPPIVTHTTTEADKQQWHENGLRGAKRLLEGLIDEVTEYWPDAGEKELNVEQDSGSVVRLFISHRASDRELAKAIADLLRGATGLQPSEIRCTSVDGYRLPGGADTDSQLRREVLESAALIGLITPSAMSSAYVLFELGARWGAGKHLCPVLARGATDKTLGGPLGGKNALHIEARAEVIQMVEEIAGTLKCQIRTFVALQDAIDAVVRLACEVDPVKPPAEKREKKRRTRVSKEELALLQLLAKAESRPAAPEIAQSIRLTVERTKYHLTRLEHANLVDFVENWSTGERYYYLSHTGRSLLVERGLL